MSYEPNFSKKKKKTIIYLISGLIAIVGTGTIAYLVWPKKETKTEIKEPQEQKVQHLQRQLSQIKTALNTLNHNINQTETSLSQKKTERTQSPQNNSLTTEITQLEQQLTTYKNQKQKLESIIPKLEQQINSLNEGKSNSINSEAEQEKVIQQLEQEIKEINEELGIKEGPDKPNEEKKPDKPSKSPQSPDKKKSPNQDKSPSPQTPDLPNSSLQDLLSDLKLVQDYLENCNKINEANKQNLTKTADGRSKYQVDKTKYQEGLKEVNQLWDKFSIATDADKQLLIKTRTELRKKWSNIFNPKFPSPDNNSPNNPQNIQTFQTLKSQCQEINTLIGKINQDFQEFTTEWKSGSEADHNLVEAMFKDYFSIKALAANLEGEIAGCGGTDFLTDSEEQKFKSLTPESQTKNIKLIEAVFNTTLLEVKRNIVIVYQFMEKAIKWCEDFANEMKKLGVDTSKIETETSKSKSAVATCHNLLQNWDQKTVTAKIQALQESYQELDKANWKDQTNKK